MVEVNRINGQETEFPNGGPDGVAFNHFVQKATTDTPGTAADIQLRDAIKQGNMQVVAQILNGGTANINWVDKQNGYSFLHYAMSSDESMNAIEYLIKAGIDIRKTNKDGKTAYEMLNDKMEKEKIPFLSQRYAHIAKTVMWVIDKGTEEIEKIAAGGMKKAGDFMEANKWLAAGGSIFPLMGKFPLHSVLHLRPEDQVRYVKFLFDDKQGQIKDMVDNGQIDRKALMDQEVNGVKPYEFFKNMADDKKIDEASRKRYQEIADILKENGAPGSEEPEEEPEEESVTANYGPPNANWKMPETEKRSAQEIINQTPILRELKRQHKEWLKYGFDGWDNGNHKKPDNPFKGIGDFEKDPEKAWLAVQILQHIQNYDDKGNKVTGEGGDKNKINGFFGNLTKDANPGTEAARLLDFMKFGWGTLHGGKKEPPKEPPTAETNAPEGWTYEKVMEEFPILANLSDRGKDWIKYGFKDWNNGDHKKPDKPFEGIGDWEKDKDVDKAYRAARILEWIENYGPNGKIADNDNLIGNNRIDGFFKKGGKDWANPDTESARLQDFAKYGFDHLKGFTAPVPSSSGGGDFVAEIRRKAFESIIAQADLPDSKKDMIDNPDKYTAKQRHAARLELLIAYDNISQHPDYWKDPKQLRRTQNAIKRAVKKLHSEEVQKYADKVEPKAFQDVLASDPTLKAQAQKVLKDMREKGTGLDNYVKKGKDIYEGMGAYLGVAQMLNQALGSNGEPLIENLTLNTRANPAFKLIEQEFRDNFAKPDTLKKLIKEKGEEEAFTEFSGRAMLFSSFDIKGIEGEDGDIYEIDEIAADNIQEALLGDVSVDDFKGSGIINDKGEVDEDFLTKALEVMRKNDPDHPIFIGDDGQELSNAQIVTATRASFDSFRNAAKVNAANGKANLKQFLATDSKLKKTFGSGMMHGVSAILCAGIAIARSQSGQELSTETKIAIAGNSIQAFGVALQGFEFTQRPDNFNNKLLGWGDGKKTDAQFKAKYDPRRQAIMNIGKTLNGAGGMAAGVMGIVFGVQAQNQGDQAMAGVFYTQGISNLLTASGPLTEALTTGSIAAWNKFANSVNARLLTQILPRVAPETIARLVTGRLFSAIGSASLVLNIVAALAAVGFAIWDSIKNHEKKDVYQGTWKPITNSYGLPGAMDFSAMHDVMMPEESW